MGYEGEEGVRKGRREECGGCPKMCTASLLIIYGGVNMEKARIKLEEGEAWKVNEEGGDGRGGEWMKGRSGVLM